MANRPLFSAFGIPITVDPFFIFGAFIIYSWSGGGRAGMFTVIGLFVFVLIHELGHALTARSFGARTSITVSFLGGFASYVPTRKLTTRHQVAISVMGPLTQIVAAIPVLWWATHKMSQPLVLGSRENLLLWQDVYSAVMWAGILIGFLNLIPLWPLDGGHIAESLLTKAVGDRAPRILTIFTAVASILMLGMFLIASVRGTDFFTGLMKSPFSINADGSLRVTVASSILSELRRMPTFIFGGTIFIPFITLLASWSRFQQLQRVGQVGTVTNVPTAKAAAHEDAIRLTRQAERTSWISARVADFPRGWSPSPWVNAHIALVHGDQTAGVEALSLLADGAPRNWLLDRPDRPEIASLLDYVPPEAASSLAVLEARVHHGSAEDLVSLATSVFIDERSAEPLYLGGAGLAVRGMDSEAMQWLERAVTIAPDPRRLSVERDYERLHRRSDFQQLLGRAERAVQSS